MPAPSASVLKFLQECQTSDKASFRIHFPAATVTKPGLKLSKAETRPPPAYSISSTIAKSNTAKYLLISLDLDAPAPSISGLLSPILHELQVDLTVQGEPDADGFVKLASNIQSVAAYAPPGPPGFSSPHRYVFMVWEQPEGLTSSDVKTKLGVPDQLGLSSRIRWKQDACEKKLGLGKALGGNYFNV